MSRPRRVSGVSWLLLVVSVICTAVWLLVGRGIPFVVRVPMFLVASLAWALLLTPRVRPSLRLGPVIASAVCLGVVAVALPPRTSGDVWSYVMDGRTVSQHHANPYRHSPAAYPHDPFTRRVAEGWRHTSTVYGPLFVGLGAVGTWVAGSSALLNRLWFQVLEALAVAGAMLVLWRRTRDPAAVAFVSVNPAMVAIVNGGHNDLLVGLAVLVGVVLLLERHPVWAGVALGLGALVKVTALLPLAVLCVWVWRRWGPRTAATLGATGASLVAAAYLAAGGRAALHPLLELTTAGGSRSAIWRVPQEWLVQRLEHRGHRPSVALDLAIRQVGHLSEAVIAVALVVVVLRIRRDSSPAVLAGTSVVVFLLAGAYVLPWYSASALVVLGLAWRSRLALVAVVQAAVMVVAYAAKASRAGPGGAAFYAYYGVVVPIVFVVGLAVVLAGAVRHHRHPREPDLIAP